MRILVFGALALAVGCGGDSSGPNTQTLAGSYAGSFYVIASSTSPADRDSLHGGAVTSTLAGDGPEYTWSVTDQTGGSSADVSINSAGAMTFPGFNEAEALDLLGSFLLDICDLSQANATPSGSVVSNRLTVSILTSGAVCDWGGGDVRATLLQLTWTGTR